MYDACDEARAEGRGDWGAPSTSWRGEVCPVSRTRRTRCAGVGRRGPVQRAPSVWMCGAAWRGEWSLVSREGSVSCEHTPHRLTCQCRVILWSLFCVTLTSTVSREGRVWTCVEPV